MFLHIRPPRARQYSSSDNIAKKHKNKLFAITAVPMGTVLQRVCPLRHSSAQTVCKPTPHHTTQTKRCGGGGDKGVNCCTASTTPSLFLQEAGPHAEPCYQCKRLAGPACEKCHKGKKDQDSWDVGPAVLIRTLPLLNKDHTFPAAGATLAQQSCSSKPARLQKREGEVNSRRSTGKTINK